tara:strand:- start:923 stop:1201 length:279 start_codon:yes stop_codon:yes gene_type:complete
MLVENLGHVTFVNGILRVQCISIDPEGKTRESGIIEIPGANVNAILNGLINSAKAIEGKLQDLEAENKTVSDNSSSNGKKDEDKNKKNKKKK